MAFQHIGGGTNYEALMKIPVIDRVPGLVVKYGEEKIHALITVMLTDFVDSLNVTRKMSPAQIVACAYEMMISTREDFLSIEDFAMFFKNATNGKYGKFYEGIDQAKVFEMLSTYREARTESYENAKYEQEQQHKALPVNDRIADMFQSERDKMREATITHLKSKKDEPLPQSKMSKESAATSGAGQ